MAAYYNEHDKYAAKWLRNLIAAGHLPLGEVDERDIRDVTANELAGFTQCHFFAGIGVWPHALRRAGWPDDRPIWTGSCPCQPFSAAGKRGGEDDERHLWPSWHFLIEQRRPPVVVGEQVASKDGLGWLDLVSTDLEGANYTFGAADLCAAGFSGAHIRQRLYFAGLDNAAGARRDGPFQRAKSHSRNETRVRMPNEGGGVSCLGDAKREGLSEQRGLGRIPPAPRRAGEGQRTGGADTPARPLADVGSRGREVAIFERQDGRRSAEERQTDGSGGDRSSGRTSAPMLGRYPADWLFCRDGRWRPVESGTFPLAHAPPARVGRLRSYGNALDAETATEFVAVVMGLADQFESVSCKGESDG